MRTDRGGVDADLEPTFLLCPELVGGLQRPCVPD